MADEILGPTSRTDEILRASMQLFADSGYVATTMEDIGRAVGMRGPSLYKHVRSKQVLLAEIIVGSMRSLYRAQADALASAEGPVAQLESLVRCHVVFQTSHTTEAFISVRELRNLEEPYLVEVLTLRREYERALRAVIERGVTAGAFTVSPPLASFAIIDMGVGVLGWFQPTGPLSGESLADEYARFALRLVGA